MSVPNRLIQKLNSRRGLHLQQHAVLITLTSGVFVTAQAYIPPHLAGTVMDFARQVFSNSPSINDGSVFSSTSANTHARNRFEHMRRYGDSTTGWSTASGYITAVAAHERPAKDSAEIQADAEDRAADYATKLGMEMERFFYDEESGKEVYIFDESEDGADRRERMQNLKLARMEGEEEYEEVRAYYEAEDEEKTVVIYDRNTGRTIVSDGESITIADYFGAYTLSSEMLSEFSEYGEGILEALSEYEEGDLSEYVGNEGEEGEIRLLAAIRSEKARIAEAEETLEELGEMINEISEDGVGFVKRGSPLLDSLQTFQIRNYFDVINNKSGLYAAFEAKRQIEAAEGLIETIEGGDTGEYGWYLELLEEDPQLARMLMMDDPEYHRAALQAKREAEGQVEALYAGIEAEAEEAGATDEELHAEMPFTPSQVGYYVYEAVLEDRKEDRDAAVESQKETGESRLARGAAGAEEFLALVEELGLDSMSVTDMAGRPLASFYNIDPEKENAEGETATFASEELEAAWEEMEEGMAIGQVLWIRDFASVSTGLADYFEQNVDALRAKNAAEAALAEYREGTNAEVDEQVAADPTLTPGERDQIAQDEALNVANQRLDTCIENCGNAEAELDAKREAAGGSLLSLDIEDLDPADLFSKDTLNAIAGGFLLNRAHEVHDLDAMTEEEKVEAYVNSPEVRAAIDAEVTRSLESMGITSSTVPHQVYASIREELYDKAEEGVIARTLEGAESLNSQIDTFRSEQGSLFFAEDGEFTELTTSDEFTAAMDDYQSLAAVLDAAGFSDSLNATAAYLNSDAFGAAAAADLSYLAREDRLDAEILLNMSVVNTEQAAQSASIYDSQTREELSFNSFLTASDEQLKKYRDLNKDNVARLGEANELIGAVGLHLGQAERDEQRKLLGNEIMATFIDWEADKAGAEYASMSGMPSYAREYAQEQAQDREAERGHQNRAEGLEGLDAALNVYADFRQNGPGSFIAATSAERDAFRMQLSSGEIGEQLLKADTLTAQFQVGYKDMRAEYLEELRGTEEGKGTTILGMTEEANRLLSYEDRPVVVAEGNLNLYQAIDAEMAANILSLPQEMLPQDKGNSGEWEYVAEFNGIAVWQKGDEYLMGSSWEAPPKDPEMGTQRDVSDDSLRARDSVLQVGIDNLQEGLEGARTVGELTDELRQQTPTGTLLSLEIEQAADFLQSSETREAYAEFGKLELVDSQLNYAAAYKQSDAFIDNFVGADGERREATYAAIDKEAGRAEMFVAGGAESESQYGRQLFAQAEQVSNAVITGVDTLRADAGGTLLTTTADDLQNFYDGNEATLKDTSATRFSLGYSLASTGEIAGVLQSSLSTPENRIVLRQTLLDAAGVTDTSIDPVLAQLENRPNDAEDAEVGLQHNADNAALIAQVDQVWNGIMSGAVSGGELNQALDGLRSATVGADRENSEHTGGSLWSADAGALQSTYFDSNGQISAKLQDVQEGYSGYLVEQAVLLESGTAQISEQIKHADQSGQIGLTTDGTDFVHNTLAGGLQEIRDRNDGSLLANENSIAATGNVVAQLGETTFTNSEGATVNAMQEFAAEYSAYQTAIWGDAAEFRDNNVAKVGLMLDYWSAAQNEVQSSTSQGGSQTAQQASANMDQLQAQLSQAGISLPENPTVADIQAAKQELSQLDPGTIQQLATTVSDIVPLLQDLTTGAAQQPASVPVYPGQGGP